MFNHLLRGVGYVVYPPVCYLCGNAMEGQCLCPFCLHDKFEDPNPFGFASCNGVILPDDIRFQDALWQFEKGNSVQEILHGLKYGGMAAMGVQVGYMLGERLLGHPLFSYTRSTNYSVLPVPLHPARRMKRGYNQARLLALGVSKQTGVTLLTQDVVRRKKHTRSQTGFSLAKRLRNVKNAFEVVKTKEITGRDLIIIDDVFTTGATTFELWDICRNAGARSAIILTIAQA